MGFFGLSTKKEVAEKEAAARAAGRSAGYSSGREAGAQGVINSQQHSLSNLGKGSQVRFAVPYFDVFDPRFEDFGVPIAVHGSLVYAIEDINKFNSINKSESFSDNTFEQKLKGQLAKYIKGVVTNAPYEYGINVMQIERKILEISELLQKLVTPKIEELFAIKVRSLDVTQIMVDKSSRGYRELKAVTTDLEGETIKTRTSLGLSAMKRQQEMQLGGQEELQKMQLENQRETMRIQREEMQRAARLQTETNFLGAHQANLNAEVGQARVAGHLSGMGMPPMPDMPGMPQMPGTMPNVQYMVGVNGQTAGPYNWMQLQQLVQSGQLTQQSYVWKQGMAQWESAGNVAELSGLFVGGMPQMPGM